MVRNRARQTQVTCVGSGGSYARCRRREVDKDVRVRRAAATVACGSMRTMPRWRASRPGSIRRTASASSNAATTLPMKSLPYSGMPRGDGRIPGHGPDSSRSASSACRRDAHCCEPDRVVEAPARDARPPGLPTPSAERVPDRLDRRRRPRDGDRPTRATCWAPPPLRPRCPVRRARVPRAARV